METRFDVGGSYILVGSNPDGCCVIRELFVQPEDRRKQVGTTLVHLAREWGKSQDLFPLIVQCSPRNEDGKAFYESLGMRQVAIVYQED